MYATLASTVGEEHARQTPVAAGPDAHRRMVVSWSTRELADLADTTVNAVRHYHALGLLEEPQRRYNGYKQYGVRHLVRLLRLRRLVELGVPLSQIGAEDTGATGGLRDVDAGMKADIERLRRARTDIAAILRDGAPADSPRGFESVAAKLSDADYSLIHVYSRLFDDEVMDEIRRMVGAESDAVSAEFSGLAPEADEQTRQRLAERIAHQRANWRSPRDVCSVGGARPLSKGECITRQTLMTALFDLYHAAQRDVIHRAAEESDRIASTEIRTLTDPPPTRRPERHIPWDSSP